MSSSYLPAVISSKLSIVSLSETSLPARPVNCAATKNGCERKRWILRARETISSFERVVAGEFDQLPEQAFYMVGGIDEVVAQAQRLAST